MLSERSRRLAASLYLLLQFWRSGFRYSFHQFPDARIDINFRRAKIFSWLKPLHCLVSDPDILFFEKKEVDKHDFCWIFGDKR